MNRKKFIGSAGLAGLGLLAACKGKTASTDAPAVITNKKFRWKMVTTWPPNFPIFGEGCTKFADLVKTMSAGQLEIKVYGAGELIPALKVFDAVTGGAAEMGNGAAYYWSGKIAAAPFFAAVPFGMNAQQMNAWMISGGGQALWEKLYGNFNLVPMLAGNSGVQMGGWFNKSIDSIEDFKGLKMRIPGLGGQVLAKVGGSAVLSPGGELYTNLERGVIDATEWVGPYHDYLMGFHKIAKYYYTPGWHELGTALEFIVNKRKMESLPTHLQAIVKTAAALVNTWTLCEFEAKNNVYLQKLLVEEKVEIKKFPKEVLNKLRSETKLVLEELAAKDAQTKEIYEAYSSFKKNIGTWSKQTEKVFYTDIQE